MWFMHKKEPGAFNFLGASFISCKSIYCCENHPVMLTGPAAN